MSAEENVISNYMLRDHILSHLTSQDLLQSRLVCKLWRDEANRLIRHRQQKFFFSPSSKTKSNNYNDCSWKKSWENVLEISFIYSMVRNTYIRASHRLIVDAYSHSKNLDVSSLDPQERQIEASFNQEIEDYHNGSSPRTSPDSNSNCKMAGHTLAEFTDYLESISISSREQDPNPNDLDDNLDHSNFPFLSFRFEGDQLWGRRELSQFFKVMGPKIRYLTISANHGNRVSRSQREQGFYYPDINLDREYRVIRLAPNLQVLTLVLRSRLFEDGSSTMLGRMIVSMNQMRAQLRHQVEDPGGFPSLKILRIQERGNELTGPIARGILDKAGKVEKVIFEKGCSLSLLLPTLGEFNFDFVLPQPDQDHGQNQSGTVRPILPRPVCLIVPITGLFLQVFKDSPQTVEYIAQIIDLQQTYEKRHRVKSLNLSLTKPPAPYENRPYDSPVVPPLLRILKAGVQSLETLSLNQGAGVFLQGLIQIDHFNHDLPENRLESFPCVHMLSISMGGPRGLHRTTFNWMSPGVDSAVTSLSKVFPKVEDLNVDDAVLVRERSQLWECFLPTPGLTKSLKKMSSGSTWLTEVYQVYTFPNLQTLYLGHEMFVLNARDIWTVSSLQTLMIDGIFVRDASCEESTPRLEALFTGLSNEVIKESIEDLESTLPNIAAADLEQFLEEKRAAFRSRLDTSTKCIFDLGQLRHLKLLIYNPRRLLRLENIPSIFGQVSGIILLDLLPPSCHLTIWAMCDREIPQPLPFQMLVDAVGSMVSSHPRVSLRTVRADIPNFLSA